ncbi:hypothetical protein PVAP13_8NG306441 [Panicum virgatum]|uniref:Uncharacterized protein n=1 Tax=Panicum virgatum TaxID=38727 RepID=A0A8T0PCS2_PANVG|nr:hypothetical protein PVAP13_8NG306441 [Panicum virgatum]
MAGRRVDSPTKHCYKICIYPCSGPWASCNQPIPHYSGRPDPITIPPAQAYDCSAAATGDVGHRLLRRRRQRGESSLRRWEGVSYEVEGGSAMESATVFDILFWRWQLPICC